MQRDEIAKKKKKVSKAGRKKERKAEERNTESEKRRKRNGSTYIQVHARGGGKMASSCTATYDHEGVSMPSTATIIPVTA